MLSVGKFLCEISKLKLDLLKISKLEFIEI